MLRILTATKLDSIEGVKLKLGGLHRMHVALTKFGNHASKKIGSFCHAWGQQLNYFTALQQ